MTQSVKKTLGALFWITLPVTSFPYFPAVIGGSALVRPLALYPLAGLILLVTIPHFFTKPIPKTVIPIFVFILIATISSAFALTRGIEPITGVTVESRAIRMLITLVLGTLFYLTISFYPSNADDLKFSIRWLLIGFVIALIWGSLQVVFVLKFNRSYFDFINTIQSHISIRTLFARRVSGLTYEPSWFAEQIGFLLMPWLFAAVISNYSVFNWRWRWVTIEVILLGWSAFILLFTYSREGLAIFFVLFVLVILLYPRKVKSVNRELSKIVIRRVLQTALILVILAGIVFLAGENNKYFSRMWGYWTDPEATGTYLQYIAFSQRFTYWNTAYNIFMDYPVFGIGVGSFMFYFEEYLPNIPLTPIPEILYKLVPDIGKSMIVTPKNMLIRILAETGVVGFAIFLSFLVAISGCAIYLWLSERRAVKYWGWAGIFGIIAFLLTTLSVDSFAIPNMWVFFGLITASANVLEKQPS